MEGARIRRGGREDAEERRYLQDSERGYHARVDDYLGHEYRSEYLWCVQVFVLAAVFGWVLVVVGISRCLYFMHLYVVLVVVLYNIYVRLCCEV